MTKAPPIPPIYTIDDEDDYGSDYESRLTSASGGFKSSTMDSSGLDPLSDLMHDSHHILSSTYSTSSYSHESKSDSAERRLIKVDDGKKENPKFSLNWNELLWLGICLLVLVSITLGLALGLSGRSNNAAPSSTIAAPTNPVPSPPTSEIQSVSKRLVQSQDFLSSLGVSSVADLTTADTSQYLAASWIANDDSLQLPVPEDGTSISNADTRDFVARYVLAVNYFAMGGSQWSNSSNFLLPIPACMWNVNASGLVLGVRCDASKHPIELVLPQNNLVGTFPSENGFLTKLVRIELQGNRLSGSIPDSICNLGFLMILFLQKNKMNGVIPNCFGESLPYLQEISLEENNLTGTTPASFCNATRLQRLSLGQNHLLSGSLPTCIGNLRGLTALYISNSSLSGMLPESLCRLTNLEELSLGYNHFEGPISDCLGQLSNLVDLYLRNNRFSGGLPDLSRLVKLEALMLDDNLLTGNINSLNTLKALRLLYLDNNMFEGDLGTFGESLNLLEQLDLSNNTITSTNGIPIHLLSLPNLEILDVGSNLLEGTLTALGFTFMIPTDGPLDHLAVRDNHLQGPIPVEITNLRQLKHLDLSRNNFTGPLIEELGMLSSLTYLFVAENPHLSSGPIPPSFLGLTNMQELSLRNTNRTGEILDFGTSLVNLELLDLDSNNFEGEVPSSIGNLTKLEHLLLSRNTLLNGSLPASFSSLVSAINFVLDATGLTGNIDFLCNLPSFTPGRNESGRIYADCGGTSPRITSCSCCECCDSSLPSGCSRPQVNSLDLEWENSFGMAMNTIDFAFNAPVSAQNP